MTFRLWRCLYRGFPKKNLQSLSFRKLINQSCQAHLPSICLFVCFDWLVTIDVFDILYTVCRTFVIPKGSLKSSGVMSSPVKQSSKVGKKFTELTTFIRTSKPSKTSITKIEYLKKKNILKNVSFHCVRHVQQIWEIQNHLKL